MGKRILVLNGHPDPRPQRLCAALALAYADAALAAGHEVRRIAIGAFDFPLLASAEEFASPAEPGVIRNAQDAISWAEHLVFVYPLWLGSQPAKLKGFLEQIARGGFALGGEKGRIRGMLKGRSAHLYVTMGMPGLVYSLWFGALGVRSLESGILRLCGIAPVRHTFFGMVEADPRRPARWLARMHRDGARAA